MRYKFCYRFFLGFSLFCIASVNAYAQREFLYSNNNLKLSNSVSAFSINANGGLTQITGSPFPTGGVSTGETVPGSNLITIVGNFLYASNTKSDTVSAFLINSDTGSLTEIAGSPFATGGFGYNGIALSATPNGRFLMAANRNSENITVFSIAPNGGLTSIAGSPFPIGRYPDGIKVSPDGRFLAVANPSSPSGRGVTMFTIANNGELTMIAGSPFGTDNLTPSTFDFSCGRNLLFVGEHYFPTVRIDVFQVNFDGTLTAIPTSPFIQPIGIRGQSGQVALLSPDERFLFVSNENSNTVTVFNVASDGSLTVPGVSYPVGSDTPTIMMTNRNGTILYIGNQNWPFHANISAFHIAQNGSLTPVQGSPFSTGQSSGVLGPISIARYPTKDCNEIVGFDLCIQDESSRDVLRINTTTGAYQLTRCRDGLTVGGTGTLSKRGCTLSFQDSKSDRRIMASIDSCSNRATASVQIFAQGSSFTLTDRNTTNNTCSCPNSN